MSVNAYNERPVLASTTFVPATTSPRYEDQLLPGLPPGVYRVAVTKDGVTIPARYNTETTLGCEVFGGGRGGSTTLALKLTSR